MAELLINHTESFSLGVLWGGTNVLKLYKKVILFLNYNLVFKLNN